MGRLRRHGLGGLRRDLERLPPQAGDDAPQDLHQARPAGVDDTGLAQDGEELRRALHGFAAAREGGVEHVVEGAAGLGGLLRRLGHGPNDGEHRPLHRLPHGPVGRVGGGPEGGRRHGAVELGGAGQVVAGSAEDLREDDPGVAPGAHEGGVPDGAGHGRGRRRRLPGQRLDHALHRLAQVRARVAVRDGIHVEVVDVAPGGGERRRRTVGGLADPGEQGLLGRVPHGRRTPWMWTCTAVTRSPVRRSTS